MLNHIEGNPSMCWATDVFTVNPRWVNNFALLRKYGLGFDLMCFANMMHRMADLAHRYPDVMVYLEHCGMPYQHDDAGREAWRSGMKALAASLKSLELAAAGQGDVLVDAMLVVEVKVAEALAYRSPKELAT